MGLRGAGTVRLFLFQEFVPADRRAKIVFSAVGLDTKGVFLGKIGVADFVLDHDSLKAAARTRRVFPSRRAEDEADGEVNKIGKKKRDDEPNHRDTHSSTLNHPLPAVNSTRFSGNISRCMIS